MKHTLSLVLALALMLSLFAGTAAHAEEPVTLTVAVEANALIDDYQNNYFTQDREEKFGVKLQMEV